KRVGIQLLCLLFAGGVVHAAKNYAGNLSVDAKFMRRGLGILGRPMNKAARTMSFDRQGDHVVVSETIHGMLGRGKDYTARATGHIVGTLPEADGGTTLVLDFGGPTHVRAQARIFE